MILIMILNININTGITMVDEKNKIHPAKSLSRKKIWELEKTWLCSIIGTCLSMHEARKIGRKFGAKCSDPTQIDAVVHSMLVRDCAEKNQISIHVNKILEKKFEGAIRTFQKQKSSSDILQLWRVFFDRGLIPGAYWATATMRELSREDSNKIYSDVHMLSHLIGSSNQSLIQRLVEVESHIKALENKHGWQRQKLEATVSQLENKLQRSENSVNLLQRQLAKNTSDKKSAKNDANCEKTKLRIIRQRCAHLENLIESTVAKLEIRNRRLRESEKNIKYLEKSLISVEQLLISLSDNSDSKITRIVSGKSFLYVGGMPHTAGNMQKMIAQMGGNLAYHNGGSGKSDMSSLANLVANADAVFVPMDNVSHHSALEAKKQCKLLQRKFIPIKSSGIASFTHALSMLDVA